MNVSEKILVNRESIEEIQTKLKGLKLRSNSKEIQSTINEIIEILNNELNIKNISIEDMIKNKMIETKISNPELHFKLYMLYRKLCDGKINEEDALKYYEIYITI